jgi:diguanylate cyclase (GGDEF)-like protein
MEESVVLSVVDRSGSIIASSRASNIGGQFEGSLPERSAVARIHLEDRFTSDGEAIVGGLRSFERFDWWLVYEHPYEKAFAPVVAAISRVTFINLAIVVVMCMAAFRIAVSIVRPIEALSEAAQRISDGDRDIEIPEQQGSDEVAVLSRVFRDMTRTLTRNAVEIERSYATIEETNQSLQLKNEELQEMNEILEQLSITDGLTKLHNHRHFQEALASECKRADRTGEPLALILIDIDEFKKWNDRLGHAGGDEILRKMAMILNDDVRETDVLARYGGEEFALLCPDTHMLGAANLAEKLRHDISEFRFFLDPPSEQMRVTISAGVALYDGDRQRLFNEADNALYRAKDAGRDCVVLADEHELERAARADEDDPTES